MEKIWLIAYINRDYIDKVDTDLKRFGFEDVKAYIPTVRLIKKQFKGKNQYEDVPLLFNYGFFNVSAFSIRTPGYISKLKDKIPAIYGWVKDPLQAIKSRPALQVGNGNSMPNSDVAMATEEEILTLLKTSEYLSVFSLEEMDRLKEGSFIILKGYPYEGMPAEIVSISKEKKTVKVKLLLETMMAEALVNFENIFYTVYNDFEEEQKEQSLDEIDSKGKRNLDKLYASISYGDQ
jgi:hypothetical protein